MPIKTLTIDTNILNESDLNDLKAVAKAKGFEIAAVSVTHRETENGLDFNPRLAPLDKVLETGVWDESRWDESNWGQSEADSDLEKILQIISNGSFPKKNNRQSLSKGHLAQLRDAINLSRARQRA